MKRRKLQQISLIISTLILLYLLFINISRDTFITTDWFVVTIDLLAKTVIDIILISKK